MEAGNKGEQVTAAAKAGRTKVAVLGFGTVGSSVARILLDGPASAEMELVAVFNRDVARKKAAWAGEAVRWTENVEEILSSDADVVVELAGGLEPASTWVRRALISGKSVVTANKKLIAAQGTALHALAREHGVHLYYGAAVAGGIPVIPGLQQGLAGERVERIEGILNGTCNFILSGMEEGKDYAPMLAEAQARGFAEADPTEDVGGFDARAKLVILSRLALRVDIPVEGVSCRPITRVSAIDFDYAKLLGCTVRQVARAELAKDGSVLATVGPMLVPQRSPLAWSRGTENMVLIGGAYGGDVVFSGHGAGGDPTAVAVVSDLLAVAHGSSAVAMPSRTAEVHSDLHLRHVIRFVVTDRPGIVAELAKCLASEGINIDSLLQKPGYAKENMPFVVSVEACAGSTLQRALARIECMDCLLEPPFAMEILEQE
jgi:homoserine dehydrogenase